MRFKGLPPSARVVGYEIVNHWNYKTKSCYPSQEYLSKKLHLSSPTVKRAIKLLEQCNIIKVERKMGMSNRYLINFVELTWIEPSKKMIPVSPVIPKSINIYNNINTSIKNEEKVDKSDVKRVISNFTKSTNSAYQAVVQGKQHRKNSLEAIAQRVRKRLTVDHFNSWYEAAYSKDKSTAFNALQYATKVLNV